VAGLALQTQLARHEPSEAEGKHDKACAVDFS